MEESQLDTDTQIIPEISDLMLTPMKHFFASWLVVFISVPKTKEITVGILG